MKGISNKKASLVRFMFMGLGLVVVLGLLVGLFIHEANAAEDERRLKLIMRVDEVNLEILPSKVPQLYISAEGVVSSTGWQDPQLVPVDTNCPKSFKCFEFVAKPPTGITNPVITHVSADYKLEDWQHVKKIKVIAKTNSIIKAVEKPEKLKTSQRQDYFGPVLLTKYAVDKAAHFFWVDDPDKLPEKAVAARVILEKTALANLMLSAYQGGKKVSVAPGHRYWLEGGKLAWTIWAARIE
ncbi:MAG: hypothetical protein JSV88_13370 [Candidatus Aminicenantes bacterium]|nr:MAG: hypothetical protein JSV88_13370 [Candidatus Aminicenantes bacterium]